MASDLNSVTLVGRLTADPELRSLSSGTSVCGLRLAFTSSRKDSSGAWVDESNFVDVTVWGGQGESAARHLAKGRRVGILGRLRFSEWEAKDGTRRSKIDVVADRVQFLDSREEGGERQAPRSDVPTDAPPASAPLPADDDIPF